MSLQVRFRYEFIKKNMISNKNKLLHFQGFTSYQNCKAKNNFAILYLKTSIKVSVLFPFNFSLNFSREQFLLGSCKGTTQTDLWAFERDWFSSKHSWNWIHFSVNNMNYGLFWKLQFTSKCKFSYIWNIFIRKQLSTLCCYVT